MVYSSIMGQTSLIYSAKDTLEGASLLQACDSVLLSLPSAGAGSQPSGTKQSAAADASVNGRQDTGKDRDGKAESGKPLQLKEGDDKKKATTKAERRAVQERQRAEKAAAKVLPGVSSLPSPCSASRCPSFPKPQLIPQSATHFPATGLAQANMQAQVARCQSQRCTAQ